MKTETKSEYELQAERFLADTGTTMSKEFLTDSATFDTDKPGWKRFKWNVTFTCKGKSYTFPFTGSVWNQSKNSSFPTKAQRKETLRRRSLYAYDVLACLTKYDPGTHADFCSDLGYDVDSRKGLDTYLAVQGEFDEVKFLWGDVLDLLREIN